MKTISCVILVTIIGSILWAYLAGAFEPVPVGAFVTDPPIMLFTTDWGPEYEAVLKPVYLGNNKWRFEDTGERHRIWPSRWSVKRPVVLDWWSNRTVSKAESGKETIWY